jgi:outer membrane lipoprotein LolB
MARPAIGSAWASGSLSRGAAATLAAIALATLACACSNLPAPTAAERSYAGRFSLAVTAVQAGAETQRSAWNGRFALAVGPQSLTLDLVSPLGATIARFETDPREARLLVPADGGVRVSRGADAQALSEQVLGWSLPVEAMSDWVEGRPSSQRPFQRLPAEQGNERFEQDGWSVTVEHAVEGQSGRRLRMERPARDGLPAVALRVVLDGPAT